MKNVFKIIKRGFIALLVLVFSASLISPALAANNKGLYVNTTVMGPENVIYGQAATGNTGSLIKLNTGGAGGDVFMVDSSGKVYSASSYCNLAGTACISPGNGLLPRGRNGSTLYYSGGAWATSSNIYNNNGNVGIGTTNPLQKLDVNGSVALPDTTGAASGVVYKGGSRFIHNFSVAGTFGGNTFVGSDAGNFSMTTTGWAEESSNNTGIGKSALSANTTGYRNIAVGAMALFSNTDGGENTAIGPETLLSNTSGVFNTAIGNKVLYNNTIGLGNIAIGSNGTMFSNVGGSYNIAVGLAALDFNFSGNDNIAFGNTSMYSNTTGNNNVALGTGALRANVTGYNNVCFGFFCLYNNVDGYNNVSLGVSAGERLITGRYNTFVGPFAGTDTFGIQKNNVVNSIAIGYGVYTTADNQVVIGNSSITQTLLNGNVGIGTIYPNDKLAVASGNIGVDATYGIRTVNDANHSIVFRPGSANSMNYYEYGGISWAGFGHKFYTGGAQASQTLKLQIADDGIYMPGNIGIGKFPNASNKLAVNGNADFTGGDFALRPGGSGTPILYAPWTSDVLVVGSATWNGNAKLSVQGTAIINGNLGVGLNNITAPAYRLDVNGEPGANGYTAFTNYSDARLKKNISYLGGGYLDKILQLKPSTFNYNSLTGYDQETLDRTITGFVAQDMQKVFPGMVGKVKIKGAEYLDTNLSALPIYIVKAMQEQQKQIEALKAEIEILKAKIK